MVAIGIDLGTTNSVVSVWKDNQAVIIPNHQGKNVTPSVVAFTDKDMLVGDEATSQMVPNHENTIFGVKRIIGQKMSNPLLQKIIKQFPFTVVNDGNDSPQIKVLFHKEITTFAPEQISSLVLKNMKMLAETFLQETVTDAVITVPAYFNRNQRRATIDAAKLAGLNVLRIINEPTAAALAYGLEYRPKGTNNVVIYDLGGGTFDVSVLEIKDGCDFEVLSVAGDTHLGGVDFDNILFKHCVEEFERKHNINLNDRALQRLRIACERAKITLSQSKEAIIDLICLQDGHDFVTKIYQNQFERMCQHLFEITLECVEKALKDAKLKPSKIDEIILIGGSTRIPKIRELLRKIFGNKILNHSVHSDEAVAKGAAIQAAILSGAYCYSFGQLKDVNPLSLGVCFGHNREMSVIIRRNTKTPHKMVKRYPTLHDFQTRQDLDVYEGEGFYAADNILLRKFALFDLTPARKGKVAIDVQFELDNNEILRVTAIEVGNSRNWASIQIDNISGHLSKETIDKMINDAGKSYQLDQDRLSCIELRNQIANYISNSFEKLAGMDNLENSFVTEIAKEFAMKTKWLESNPQTSLSDIQLIFDELQKYFNDKLKSKKLNEIIGYYHECLQLIKNNASKNSDMNYTQNE